MTFGLAALVACGVEPSQARRFERPIRVAMDRIQIDSRARMAAWLAQVTHESADLTRTEENLYYTSPERIRQLWPRAVPTTELAAQLCRRPETLANRVYANRLGNGDEASGDGWRYRGRGLIMITGESLYRVTASAFGRDYLGHPDQVAEPDDAALTAAWYWDSINGNSLADEGRFDEITRRINGPAMVGGEDRRQRFARALAALA
jgi:putative chitinase